MGANGKRSQSGNCACSTFGMPPNAADGVLQINPCKTNNGSRLLTCEASAPVRDPHGSV
jgi:hypothetical protein